MVPVPCFLLLCAKERLLTLFHNTQHTSLSLRGYMFVVNVWFWESVLRSDVPPSFIDSCPKRGTTSRTHGPPFAQFNSLTRREGMPSLFGRDPRKGNRGTILSFFTLYSLPYASMHHTVRAILSFESWSPRGRQGRREGAKPLRPIVSFPCTNSLLLHFLLFRYHDSIPTRPFHRLSAVRANDSFLLPFLPSLPFPSLLIPFIHLLHPIPF